ncbi:hypothetical protein DFH09DRAFT_1073149 [Mycena vulgaris]|nr:hypothetical protein DFH09DRAFT_1073149 [Mycena vulgaris]
MAYSEKSPEDLNVWDFLPFNMGTKYYNNVILSGHRDQQPTCITKCSQLDAYSDSNSTMCDAMGWMEGGFQSFQEHVIVAAQRVWMDTFARPPAGYAEVGAVCRGATQQQQLKKRKEPDPGKKEWTSSRLSPPNERTTELNGRDGLRRVLNRLRGLLRLGVTEHEASRPDTSLTWRSRSRYVG